MSPRDKQRARKEQTPGKRMKRLEYCACVHTQPHSHIIHIIRAHGFQGIATPCTRPFQEYTQISCYIRSKRFEMSRSGRESRRKQKLRIVRWRERASGSRLVIVCGPAHCTPSSRKAMLPHDDSLSLTRVVINGICDRASMDASAIYRDATLQRLFDSPATPDVTKPRSRALRKVEV